MINASESNFKTQFWAFLGVGKKNIICSEYDQGISSLLNLHVDTFTDDFVREIRKWSSKN